MKKLLFLGAPFEIYKGGSEYQYSVIENEISNRYNIHYIFRHEMPQHEKKYGVYDYKIRRQYNEYAYTDAIKIYKLIQDFAPDVIYKRGINYITGVGVYYSIRNGIRSIIHIASDRDSEKYQFRPSKWFALEYVNKIIAGYVIKNASAIVCQTKKQRRMILENYKRNADIVLPNFHPLPKPSGEKPKNIRVLWVANFKKWKQPDVFINLAKEFQNYRDVDFVMIGRGGGGKWFDDLEKEINNLKNICYLGELPIEEVNNILSESNIFVNTSIEFEGFPNTYIQSWMRKVPVITLAFDPDDIIKQYHLGFHSKTFKKLTEDLRTLINDEDLRNKIGKNARKYSYQEHSIKNVNKLIEILEK